MAASPLPPGATNIFVWHRGALGDILLAGPALQAVASHYPGARMTLVGEPERLALLRGVLPVADIWNGQRAVWLDLFGAGGECGAEIRRLLAPFDLALVFSPQPNPEFLDRLQQAGIPCVAWLPSFPTQSGVSVLRSQEEHLGTLGLKAALTPLHLALPDLADQETGGRFGLRGGPDNPLVALAPGSGHPLKNWPLEYYAELADTWKRSGRAQVWWIVGPAERALAAKIRERFPGENLKFLEDLALLALAGALAKFQLYVGNDSGVTHLAAALQVPAVAAIFGPSDPSIWAPPGERVILVRSSQPCAPCTTGRTIRCPDNVCLTSLPPAAVITAINEAFPGRLAW